MKIQRHPSSPPRGAIAARPRARRPNIFNDLSMKTRWCTYHQKRQTKKPLYRTDQCVEPSHPVYKMSTGTEPIYCQTDQFGRFQMTYHARQQSTLSEAQNSPNTNESAIIPHESQAHGNYAPKYGQKR